jgi:hypothetical protein
MPLDTEPHSLEVKLAALRRLGPTGRVRLAVEMSEDARRISFEGERRRHPELTAAEARLAVLRRLWGAPLAALVTDAATHGR